MTQMSLLLTCLLLGPAFAFDAGGLYRPLADAIWQRLQDSPHFTVTTTTDEPRNSAPAKGMPGHTVKMETRVLHGDGCLQYARTALLETVNNDNIDCTRGIQVLNLVVFPQSGLPVWSVDLVSLPGDKHLLLLDAQPMNKNHNEVYTLPYYTDWYEKYATKYTWGGDLPPAVKKYVSSKALWTRMTGDDTHDDIVKLLRGDFSAAVLEHLDIYLELVQKEDTKVNNEGNWMDEYRQYRLDNDPAKPMLKSLYGEEWCNKVLSDVLFPPLTTR